MPRAAYFAGVDVGGTFTDVVLAGVHTHRLYTAKRLTTPDDPSAGVLAALRDALESAGARPADLQRVVHATTLATNLILERRGARVAYVTTRGFGDLLVMGREGRVGPERYDLLYEKPRPPVPRRLTAEVTERVSARGEVLRPLDAAQAEQELQRLAGQGVGAVAICLLHSYANPAHERRLAEIARRCLPGAYVALSSEVWPEFREYDRAITTVMSAYVGPLMARYLERLEQGLEGMGTRGPLHVMQSNGGVVSAAAAAARPVSSVESGPAAGVIAAAYLGGLAGQRQVISFDMGGTTAKAGLVRDGRPQTARDFHVGGSASGGGRSGGAYLIKTPAIDLAEVGAGGGSLAWVDSGGVLRVGPHSAGAQPGPACYALGGGEPTVTDADVALGYLDPDYFLGGKMALDAGKAAHALERRVAKPLNMDMVKAAAGIYDIVNASMASAVRLVTVQRGIDPREFVAVAFGGAGPAHIAAVAEEFGIPAIIIPVFPGVASALGLLASDMAIDLVRTRVMDPAAVEAGEVNAIFSGLETEGLAWMERQGVPAGRVTLQREADLRYRFQSHELTVAAAPGRLDARGVEAICAAFQDLYQQRYGVRQDGPVELVNFRLRAVGAVPKVRLSRVEPGDGDPRRALKGRRRAFFRAAGGFVETPVYGRGGLAPQDLIAGPAIIEEPDSTTVVPPGYRAEVDGYRNLVVRKA